MTSPPTCYGKDWSPTAVECRGGLDPNYTHPETHKHKRDQCNWYKPCSAKTCSTKASPTSQGFIPPGRLVHKPTTPTVPRMVRTPSSMFTSVKQSEYPYTHPTHTTHHQPSHAGWMHPYDAYHGPHAVPTQYQQPNAQMPGYLSVPEPYDPDTPWWMRLGHELLRSALKSMGHTGASFFDHMTIRKPRPPGE